MNYKQLFDTLKATPGRNDTIAKLVEYKDDATLKKIVFLALDPMTKFGIKKIPTYTPNPDGKLYLSTVIEGLLQRLKARSVTGNAAIEELKNALEELSADDAEVLIKIIQKDLDCGVQDSTANAVWGKDFIKEFPVMKASGYDEKSIKKIKFPAISQTKIDGARCQVLVEGHTVTFLSGNGREFDLHGVLDAEILMLKAANYVLDGELVLVNDDGSIMERKKGNGILNKAVRGTISKEEAERVRFIMFDAISKKCWVENIADKSSYLMRLGNLKSFMFDHPTTRLSIVESRKVMSEQEAIAHFKEELANGNEGTILKDCDAVWESGRSKQQIKMKGILSCDLMVVGTQDGTGKHQGKIGALICASSCGQLEVNVGTGLSDADREKDPSEYIGKVVEVFYNERIIGKGEGAKHSLFLPRFGEIRHDKTFADNLDLIK